VLYSAVTSVATFTRQGSEPLVRASMTTCKSFKYRPRLSPSMGLGLTRSARSD